MCRYIFEEQSAVLDYLVMKIYLGNILQHLDQQAVTVGALVTAVQAVGIPIQSNAPSLCTETHTLSQGWANKVPLSTDRFLLL